MGTAALRLEPVRLSAFDSQLAALGAGRLTRASAITYLESDRSVQDATQRLALAGVRVALGVATPVPATGFRPAIAFDLTPLGAAFDALDVVELQPIPLAHASAALMRRRLKWLAGSRAARDACRRLLRQEDAVIGWRRIVWCSITSLRAARSQVRLRPIVFDRAALQRHPLRWSYASDRAIERWAFT